jgi:outer membrane biosynthesis protein TonB
MKEKRKNNKSNLSEFLRYIRGEMTKREEHAFQRKLQKDPFAEEASEGLEGIDPRLAEKDIQRLSKQLKNRTTKKQKVTWYRIAASVAVLMILSSIFIIINKNKPTEQIAYSPAPAPEQEIQAASEQKEAIQIAEMEKPAPASPEKSKKVTEAVPIPESEAVEKEEIREDTISAGIQDAVVARVEEPVMAVVEERAMAARSALAKGTNYTEYEKEDTIPGYTPPLPVNGRIHFDKYIQDNIRRPDTTTAGQSVVVVLNFLVTTDGKIDSIIVVRSPGEIFSDEAIRLIKEGPAWKPAEQNGKVISDKVRIRIIFK